jgi:hypothetical protein
MIKPNELRIGNWVYADDKKTPIYIDSVCEWGKRPLYGIPITEALLRQCGFGEEVCPTQDGDCRFWSKDSRFALEQYLKSGEVFEYCGYDYIRVSCLHQLQNLYYALTYEEMTVPYQNEPIGE